MADGMVHDLRAPELTGHSVRLFMEGYGGAARFPSLNIVVGTDKVSAGITAYVVMPTRGRYADQKAIIRARWVEPPATTEQLVRVAVRALRRWLESQELDPE